MRWSAGGRVARSAADTTFVYVIAVLVMQVTVVKIVSVALVLDRPVPAVGAVRVSMPRMCRVVHHYAASLPILLLLQLYTARAGA